MLKSTEIFHGLGSKNTSSRFDVTVTIPLAPQALPPPKKPHLLKILAVTSNFLQLHSRSCSLALCPAVTGGDSQIHYDSCRYTPHRQGFYNDGYDSRALVHRRMRHRLVVHQVWACSCRLSYLVHHRPYPWVGWVSTVNTAEGHPSKRRLPVRTFSQLH